MIIGLVLVALVVLWYTGAHNRLIKLKKNVENSKSQIDVQIESRWDALSQLANLINKYDEYESKTIKDIIDSRNKLTQSSDLSDIKESDSKYKQVLTGLVALSERYPELKSSENYKTTMDSIVKYEDNVRYARMTYNDTVAKYNTAIEMIPTSLVAKMMNLEEKEYFEAQQNKFEIPEY